MQGSSISESNNNFTTILAFLLPYYFIHKMETNNQRRGNSQLQIKTGRNLDQPKAVSIGQVSPPSCSMALSNVQAEQTSSPTFVNDCSLAAEANEREELTFSFGQSIRNQLASMLKQAKLKQPQAEHPIVCTQCDSLCESDNRKMIPIAQVTNILQQFSRFCQDVKLLFHSVRQNFKDYKDYLVTRQGHLRNYLEKVLGTIQQKYTQKSASLQKEIRQLKQDNYFCKERAKVLEKKSEYLELNIAEALRVSALSKQAGQKINSRITELTEEVGIKNRQISSLTEENLKINACLKKFMILANSLNCNWSQGSFFQQAGKANMLKQNLNGERIDEQGIRKYNRESAYSIVEKSSQLNFKDQLSFCTLNTQEYLSNSPTAMPSYPIKNSSILQEKNSKEKVFYDSRPEKDQNAGESRRTKGWGNSTASKLSQRKYSWQMSSPEQGRDRNEILERIRKLKQDIKTDIKDLKMNSG